MSIPRWTAAAILALACAACKGRDTPSRAAGGRDGGASVRDAAAAVAPVDAGAAPAAPTADDVASLHREGEELLARWVDVQNKGDVAAYQALYEPRHFRGIKRTAAGKVKTFDGAGWARDRKRMLEIGVTVAAEDLAVETWLDPDSKLKAGVISLRFLQRWKGGSYADHGIKILQAWRDPRGGWRIVYEDLLNAEPGWERAADAAAPLALVVPKNDAEALALWKKVAPTGASYEDRLAAIPDDPAIRRPMARALLRAGGFECKQTVDSGACGEEILEWAPLPATANLADPCLRRRLALWSLERLEGDDATAVGTSLAELVALPDPESELPAAAFAAVPAGNDELRLALLRAANGEREELAEAQVAGLVGDAAIALAATELSLDAAVARLDRKAHRAALLGALADGHLEVETRSKVVDDFASDAAADVTAALVALTRDKECRLAMEAAAQLATRGTRTYLPKRPGATSNDSDLERVLCQIAHDPDDDRQEARWRELLAPEVVVRTITQNDFGELDDAEASTDDADAPSGTIVTGGDGSGTHTDEWETHGRDALPLSGVFEQWAGCREDSCDDLGRYELVIARAADGRPWITEIIEKRWVGCPC